MSANSLLIQALVYLAAGVLSVPVAKRLGLGSVLGYLLAGVIVGPFALNLVGAAEDVQSFAEFGVVILLFLIGLEVRPALLWGMRTTIFGLGTAQVVATAALVGVAAVASGLDWRVATATGLILAMSSTAIVLQSLEERGLRQGRVGEASFGVLLFQDLAVIPLFALLPLLAVHGGSAAPGAGPTGMLGALPGWAQALVQMAAVVVIVVGGRYLTRPLFRFIAAARLREIFTASALLLVVAVAALMELVGLSPALGAFLAGVVLAESEFRRELETDIEPFRGLLLGLFFITVGAGLDLGLLAQEPLVILAAVVGVIVLKAIAMYGVARIFRLGRRTSLTTAVSLAQGGEFAFVLLGFVVGAGVMPATLARLLTEVVAVSMAATPLVTAAYDRFVLSRPEAETPEPERLPFDEGPPDVIVAGFGRFGQIPARLLLANDFKVVLLDSSADQIDSVRRLGWPAHYGDAGRLDLLRTAGADKAKVLLVAVDDRDKALEIVEAAKQTFPNLKILARAYDRPHAYELLARGADVVDRETYESALNFGRHALEQLGFSDRRALKSAIVFREHDDELFRELQKSYGKEEYISASRASRETWERLIRTEMAEIEKEEAEERDGSQSSQRVEEGREQV